MHYYILIGIQVKKTYAGVELLNTLRSKKGIIKSHLTEKARGIYASLEIVEVEYLFGDNLNVKVTAIMEDRRKTDEAEQAFRNSIGL